MREKDESQFVRIRKRAISPTAACSPGSPMGPMLCCIGSTSDCQFRKRPSDKGRFRSSGCRAARR